MENNMYIKAQEYAKKMHKNQKRRWTNEDYISHPNNVCAIMKNVMNKESVIDLFSDFERDDVYTLCLLHDVVEDTTATFKDIEDKFGKIISNELYYLTNISTLADGNRKQRKRIDLEHILNGLFNVICIKIADIIDNCNNIVEAEYDYNVQYDKNDSFSIKYLLEKKESLNEFYKKYQIYEKELKSTTDNFIKDYLTRWMFIFLELYNQANHIIDTQIQKYNELYNR